MAMDPSTLDLSRYRTVSVLTVTSCMSVGRALIDAMPEDVPQHVEDAAEYLVQAIAEAHEALTDRLDNKADVGLERDFDLLIDRIWIALRARMEFWHCYLHQGVALLSKEEQAEAQIDKNRKLAEVAQELLARLFGDGVDFLRLPYPQQAEQMAARLNYIETRGLQGEFVEIVGAAPAALAKICQRRYEAMVSDRAARDNAVLVNLRPLRAKVAWAAENYAAQLLGTLIKKDAEWAKLVLKALQPMLATEVVRTNKATTSPEGEAEQALADSLANPNESPVLEEVGEQQG